MRFHDDFATHDDAAHYAVAQGVDWVNAAMLASPPICI
jgi:translation initiation factor IF-3